MRRAFGPKYRSSTSRLTPPIINIQRILVRPNQSNLTQHSLKSAMGSTGALIHNTNINSNTLCFDCLSSNSQSITTLRVNWRKPKLLSFSSKKCFKKFSRIVCSAVEDVTEEQRTDSAGTNVFFPPFQVLKYLWGSFKKWCVLRDSRFSGFVYSFLRGESF